MKTSDSILKISQAFVKAQSTITAALKDSLNPAFKSKYADLSSVTDAIRPAAAANGLAYLQSATMVGTNQLELTTRIIHESGEWFEFDMLMPMPKSDAHGFGSIQTYGRRYALSSIFGCVADDDDGNAATGVAVKPAYTPSVPAKPAVPAAPAAKALVPPAPDNLVELVMTGDIAAKAGLSAYQTFWTARSNAEKTAIGTVQHDKFKAVASKVRVPA